MNGLLVAGAPGLSRRPSQHYAGHFAHASADLRPFAEAFIDGELATPSGSVDVVPIEESPSYARVGLVDDALFERRCYVVDLWARPADDLARTPNSCDARGTPSLLVAVRVVGDWQVYNCYLTLVSWDRDRLYRGDYPPSA